VKEQTIKFPRSKVLKVVMTPKRETWKAYSSVADKAQSPTGWEIRVKANMLWKK